MTLGIDRCFVMDNMKLATAISAPQVFFQIVLWFSDRWAFSTLDFDLDARITLFSRAVVCTHLWPTAMASSRVLRQLVHLDRPSVELNDNLRLFFLCFLFFLARSRDGTVLFSIALVTLRNLRPSGLLKFCILCLSFWCRVAHSRRSPHSLHSNLWWQSRASKAVERMNYTNTRWVCLPFRRIGRTCDN